MVNFGNLLCSSANELQQTQMLPLKKNISHKYLPFCYRLNQRLSPDSGQILLHQYGISVTESQTLLLGKRPQGEERGETAVFEGELKGNSKTHFQYVIEFFGGPE